MSPLLRTILVSIGLAGIQQTACGQAWYLSPSVGIASTWSAPVPQDSLTTYVPGLTCSPQLLVTYTTPKDWRLGLGLRWHPMRYTYRGRGNRRNLYTRYTDHHMIVQVLLGKVWPLSPNWALACALQPHVGYGMYRAVRGTTPNLLQTEGSINEESGYVQEVPVVPYADRLPWPEETRLYVGMGGAMQLAWTMTPALRLHLELALLAQPRRWADGLPGYQGTYSATLQTGLSYALTR